MFACPKYHLNNTSQQERRWDLKLWVLSFNEIFHFPKYFFLWLLKYNPFFSVFEQKLLFGLTSNVLPLNFVFQLKPKFKC